MTALNAEHLQQWIGKQVETEDIIDLKQTGLIEATFDRSSELTNDDPLPPLWHWCFFLQGAPNSQLGRDGHPEKGDFLPPVPLPRRMWAGGRVSFRNPVNIGSRVKKISSILDVKPKEGRSGALCFVTVRHELVAMDGQKLVTEEQDIVYREDAEKGAAPAKPTAPPDGAINERLITPSTPWLFRYSALTFNGHRIHYDRDYCQAVEGYPGLVFHGPLTATLLADFAATAQADAALKSFDYRTVAPLFDTGDFSIKRSAIIDSKATIWAETPDGGLAMKAQANFG